jgi:D-sedoheptulose 7-phosphate isomerase
MKTIRELSARFPILSVCEHDIEKTCEALKECFAKGNRLYICGNGGSAADAEHIVGELMKGFALKRKISTELKNKLRAMFPVDADYLSNNLQYGLPTFSLVGQIALSTAFSNDISADLVFAQQVLGYGKKDDILFAISTSGNSENIIYAAKIAKALEIKIIGLTGCDGGKLKELCDICICIPEKETYKIQEFCLPIYHALCLELERYFFQE